MPCDIGMSMKPAERKQGYADEGICKFTTISKWEFYHGQWSIVCQLGWVRVPGDLIWYKNLNLSLKWEISIDVLAKNYFPDIFKYWKYEGFKKLMSYIQDVKTLPMGSLFCITFMSSI